MQFEWFEVNLSDWLCPQLLINTDTPLPNGSRTCMVWGIGGHNLTFVTTLTTNKQVVSELTFMFPFLDIL